MLSVIRFSNVLQLTIVCCFFADAGDGCCPQLYGGSLWFTDLTAACIQTQPLSLPMGFTGAFPILHIRISLMDRSATGMATLTMCFTCQLDPMLLMIVLQPGCTCSAPGHVRSPLYSLSTTNKSCFHGRFQGFQGIANTPNCLRADNDQSL